MFRLYERMVSWIDAMTKKNAPFIFGKLPRLLAAICFVVAALFCRKCSNQLMMP